MSDVQQRMKALSGHIYLDGGLVKSAAAGRHRRHRSGDRGGDRPDPGNAGSGNRCRGRTGQRGPEGMVAHVGAGARACPARGRRQDGRVARTPGRGADARDGQALQGIGGRGRLVDPFDPVLGGNRAQRHGSGDGPGDRRPVSLHAQGAARRRRADHAVQLPDGAARLGGGGRACGGQRRSWSSRPNTRP